MDEEDKVTNHKYENTKKGSQYSSISGEAMDWMNRQLSLHSQ
jgi:hypothetical protein